LKSLQFDLTAGIQTMRTNFQNDQAKTANYGRLFPSALIIEESGSLDWLSTPDILKSREILASDRIYSATQISEDETMNWP
jgi:hypothetical protein